jgi:hypothetical protein
VAKDPNFVSYTFRIRFNRAPSTTILTDAPEIQLPAREAGISLALRATSGKPLQEDEQWAFVGEGYGSERSAWEAGSRIQDILTLVLAKLRIGVNFGNRSPIHGQFIKTQFSPKGLQQTQQLLKDERHLNDDPGLSVYLSEPKSKFIVWPMNVYWAKNLDNFKATFLSTLTQERTPTNRERIAFELFFASFFQTGADVRLLLLVMAVESLIERQLKSNEAVAYIDKFMTQIKLSDIAAPEKSSLIGSLNDYVKYESIKAAGRRLASRILGDTLYNDKHAPAFFSYCYDLRSALVHGTPPSLEEISRIGEPMENFVSDLLTSPLLGQSG